MYIRAVVFNSTRNAQTNNLSIAFTPKTTLKTHSDLNLHSQKCQDVQVHKSLGKKPTITKHQIADLPTFIFRKKHDSHEIVHNSPFLFHLHLKK